MIYTNKAFKIKNTYSKSKLSESKENDLMIYKNSSQSNFSNNANNNNSHNNSKIKNGQYNEKKNIFDSKYGNNNESLNIFSNSNLMKNNMNRNKNSNVLGRSINTGTIRSGINSIGNINYSEETMIINNTTGRKNLFKNSKYGIKNKK